MPGLDQRPVSGCRALVAAETGRTRKNERRETLIKKKLKLGDRDKIRAMLQEGMDRHAIAIAVDVTPAQVAAVAAPVTMRTYEPKHDESKSYGPATNRPASGGAAPLQRPLSQAAEGIAQTATSLARPLLEGEGATPIEPAR